uniref:DUF4781 domain-containing protein n=1 Tax=Panagrolaimus sp. PS1159 TaxID=55785 RepID=A0AC35G2K5_9BILA
MERVSEKIQNGIPAKFESPDSMVSRNYEEKSKLQSWNKSVYLKNAKLGDQAEAEEGEKLWKKENTSDTFLLHIAPFENSVEIPLYSFNGKINEDLKKSDDSIKKCEKQIFTAVSTFVIQNPFDFPRQENDNVSAPEVSQFRASQQLLNPNETSDNDNNWKEKALQILKIYYLAFRGREFDDYNPETDIPLLRAKICYAIFGPPQTDADTIEDAYDDKQRKEAQKIVDVILKVRKQVGINQLAVGIILIYCKENEKEFSVPIFRVYTGENHSPKYVDIHCRIYNSWSDWKENNHLPKLRYCYPKNGYFSCSDKGHMFDPALDPVVEYGTSPACKLSSQTARIFDITAAIGTLGVFVTSIATLLTPAGWIGAPILLTAEAVGWIGSASAIYDCGREIYRLYDKSIHGESLTDFESATLWISVVATPFHFVSSLADAKLVAGAKRGRIFSNSTRMFATTLKCTNLGLDGVMLGFGLTNLIEKCKSNKLKTLDVLQFSLSVLFFSHTLMQPVTAKAVIQEAQHQHIQRYSDNMSDAETKASFKRFVDQNGGEMTKDSKVIRSLNHMNDPNAFFKSVKDATVDIGGKKTVLVKDALGRTNRINPNSDFKNKLQNCIGKKLDEYVLNGERIFKDLDKRQTARVGKVLRDSANYNKEIVYTAEIIAKSLGVKDADKFMSVIEIVLADLKGKSSAEKTIRLKILQSSGKDLFVKSINEDLIRATNIAKNAKLQFADPYKAVYHFRKHGHDFPSKIQGNSMDFYLGDVPKHIIQDAHLVDVQTFDDGSIKKFYTNKNDHFAVTIEIPKKQIICTMFRKEGSWKKHLLKMKENRYNVQPNLPVNDAAKLWACSLGYLAMQIFIVLNGRKTPISEVDNLDPKVHEEIARLLAELSTLEDNSSDDDDEISNESEASCLII